MTLHTSTPFVHCQRILQIVCFGLLLSAPTQAWAEGEPQLETPAHLVSIQHAEKRAIAPRIMVIGTVHSRQSSELTAGVDGRLVWVQEAGEYVTAGQVVARMEQTRLKLQQAEQLALIEREQVTLDGLARDTRRLARLIKSNHASQTDLDQAQTNQDLAKANLKLAKIKLSMILDDLRRTEVKAPFNGIITARYHQAGEDVSDSEAIVSITDPDHLELRVHAPLKHSKQVRRGDLLKVYHSGGEFDAPIRSLIPISTVRSQTFEARVDLPLAFRDQLSVGELVSLALPVAQKQETILVPRDAIVLRSSGAYLFKIDAENKATKVDITLGDGVGEWIAISGNIQENDAIVIRGGETLSAGQSVKIQPLDVAPI